MEYLSMLRLKLNHVSKRDHWSTLLPGHSHGCQRNGWTDHDHLNLLIIDYITTATKQWAFLDILCKSRKEYHYSCIRLLNRFLWRIIHVLHWITYKKWKKNRKSNIQRPRSLQLISVTFTVAKVFIGHIYINHELLVKMSCVFYSVNKHVHGINCTLENIVAYLW